MIDFIMIKHDDGLQGAWKRKMGDRVSLSWISLVSPDYGLLKLNILVGD